MRLGRTLGTVRSVSRSLERSAREFEKMERHEQAEREAGEYEDAIAAIQSIHQCCGEAVNWKEIQSVVQPCKPVHNPTNERTAQATLDNYKPNLFDKLFNRVEKRRAALLRRIEDSRSKDDAEYQKAMELYTKEYGDWKETNELATRILDGDIEALAQAMKDEEPFEEMEKFVSKVDFQVLSKDLIAVTMNVTGKDVIPSETKTLTSTGRLSVKPMPAAKSHELYQDYVCSCVLRAAREVCALLPVETVIVNALCSMVSTRTGNQEAIPILSVAIKRNTLSGFNFGAIKPSDSILNFVHRMSFSKSGGFGCIDMLSPSDL